MKLHDDYAVCNLLASDVLVKTRGRADNFVRLNSVAAHIVGCLQVETTEDAIVGSLLSAFSEMPSEDIVRKDVRDTLEKLRKIGALVE